jgi:predicted metal-dependent peptidase
MKDEMARVRHAEGTIRLAKERMAEAYPFHVALLTRMRVAARPSVGTMAVQADGEEILLLYNPDFVLGVSVAELAGVLLHEVHHVLFGHLTMSVEDYPHRPALVVAQEVTANEFICEPLPGEPVLLEDYPMLPPHESTEERYRRLAAILPPDAAVPATLDDHGAWDIGVVADKAGAEAVIRQAVEDALAAVDRGQIPEELRDALEARGLGDTPGGGVEGVSRGAGGVMDWRLLLRRYVGQALDVRPVYSRPPRRFPDMVGILPGRGRRAGRPKVMTVIDTSGSITPTLLTLIDCELRRLATCHDVVVVECDCRIQRTYRYERLKEVWGRGGTDLRPPLERAFLRQHRPDLVVYFTDGYGPAPDKPPGVPLIWCIVPGGECPAPWGRQIYMKRAGAPKTAADVPE